MSLKVKLISMVSLFMLMIGVLIIGVFAATQQQLTMQGSVSFNVPDKSLYVKDVRLKQDMASEPTSIDSFMPGYINGDFTLDLTGITDTNTYGSFSLYFDIINTTNSQWEIVDVELPTALTNAGVSASYSGIIPTNDLTDTDSDGYKNFDSSTLIDGSLILTITAPNSSTVNLEGIVITIDDCVLPVEISVYTNDENLGTASGGGMVTTGQEVSISADFTGSADADFLGWKTNLEDDTFASTLPEYTFTCTEESPTTYYAIFEEPNLYLTFDNLTEGEARLRRCEAGAVDIIVPSSIYRSSAAYNVTSIYSTLLTNSGAFYQAHSTLQSVHLPETITSISASTFSGCSELISITIPEGVLSIGDLAFYQCSSLTSITLPSSLTRIGVSAFEGCSELTQITILGEVTSVGDYAFYQCSSLTSITILESITSIGFETFSGCSNLATIYIDNSTIANGITSSTSYGYLTNYADTLYIKDTITVTSVPTGWVEDTSGSDEAGYVKYIKG